MSRPRNRGWKIVIHHVHANPQAESLGITWMKKRKLSWFAGSIEPNKPEQGPGHHLHLFLYLMQPADKHVLLKELQYLAKDPKMVTSPPPGETREWNRVDIKEMKIKDLKKDYEGCINYLQGNTKEKATGQIFQAVARPCNRGVRITNKKYEQFCKICKTAECMGCCLGCFICTPTTGHDELIRRNSINHMDNQIKTHLKNNRQKIITHDPDDHFALPRIEYL